MNKINFIFILLLNLIFSQNIFANAIKYPLVEIDNYKTSIYGGFPQNWGITQSSDGKIYFANQEGVIVFDGERWKFVEMPNLMPARSIETLKNGNIIVGGVGNFGLISKTKNNIISYQTLMSDKGKRIVDNDKIIYQISESKDGIIYVRTNRNVFEFKENKLIKLKNPVDKIKIGPMKIIENVLYVSTNKGVYRYFEQKLKLLEGTQIFNKRDNFVNFIGSNSEGLILITRLSGVFKYKNSKVEKINIENDILKKSLIYRAFEISKDRIALATYDGLFVLNKKFQIENFFNTENGLLDNNVRSVYEDRDKNLWLGLNNGISKIKFSKPLRHFDKITSNINSRTRNIKVFNDSIYLATSNGVKKSFINQEKLQQSFKEVDKENLQTQTWDLLPIGNRLFTASNKGLGFIDKNGTYQQFLKKEITNNVYSIKESKTFENHIIISSSKGAFLVDINNPSSILNLNIEKGSVWKTIEIKDRKEIWYKKIQKGVFKVSFANNNLKESKKFKIEKYTSEEGLPYKPYRKMNLLNIQEKVMLGTSKGTYQLNREENLFKLNKKLSFIENNTYSYLIRTYKVDDNNYWLYYVNYESGKRKLKFVEMNSSFIFKTLPFDNLNGLFGFKFEKYNDQILIAHNEGLVISDIKPFYPKANGGVFISQLTVNEKKIYDTATLKNFHGGKVKLIDTYSPNNKKFKFEIAASDFNKNNSVLYRHKLDNFENFSSWSRNNIVTYSNLKAGNYKLIIEAKNQFNQNLIPYEYSFTIKPPWWETTYFYVGEILFFILLILITAFS